MVRKAQVRWLAKSDVLGQRAFVHSQFDIATQRAVIDLHSLLRYFTPFATDPSGFRFGPRCQLGPPPTAWGPRSSARPNIHDDRNGIFRAGPAPWRSSRLRSSHVGFMHFVSLGPYFARSHIDAGRHRFSCPFSPFPFPPSGLGHPLRLNPAPGASCALLSRSLPLMSFADSELAGTSENALRLTWERGRSFFWAPQDTRGRKRKWRNRCTR